MKGKITAAVAYSAALFFLLVSLAAVAPAGPTSTGRCVLKKSGECIWIGPNPRKFSCRKYIESNGNTLCRARRP